VVKTGLTIAGLAATLWLFPSTTSKSQGVEDGVRDHIDARLYLSGLADADARVEAALAQRRAPSSRP
jgi:hypothetical protein